MSAVTPPELQDPFYYHRLPNGLEMLGQRMPSVGSVVFAFQVDAGIANEDDSQLGLCQILEDMLFQGTPAHDARHITEAIELLGARRISGTGYESARYGAQVVHTRMEETLALWSEILLQPTFPQKEFEQLRPLLLQAIKRRDDEPMQRVGELITKTFYQKSHMARPSLGTIDTVQSLKVSDLRDFYEQRYRADHALFAIAGNFEWENVVRLVEKYYGSWQGGCPAGYHDTPQIGPNRAVVQDETEQEHIYFGYPSITWGDPDYYANLLAIETLGGGMNSRLFSQVREKRGLVYEVSAYPQMSRDLGAVFIYGGTPPEKATETVQVIIDQLKQFAEGGITEEELNLSKIQLRSEEVMRSENAGSRMSNLLRSWWHERRVIPTSEVKTSIDAVTTEQILGLLRRFPPTNNLTLAALGPATEEAITAGLLP
jgi:predicted Zn-dependent peptidase